MAAYMLSMLEDLGSNPSSFVLLLQKRPSVEAIIFNLNKGCFYIKLLKYVLEPSTII